MAIKHKGEAGLFGAPSRDSNTFDKTNLTRTLGDGPIEARLPIRSAQAARGVVGCAQRVAALKSPARSSSSSLPRPRFRAAILLLAACTSILIAHHRHLNLVHCHETREVAPNDHRLAIETIRTTKQTPSGDIGNTSQSDGLHKTSEDREALEWTGAVLKHKQSEELGSNLDANAREARQDHNWRNFLGKRNEWNVHLRRLAQ